MQEQAVTAAVTRACDLSNGLQDGLFDPRQCSFDARSLLGVLTPCGAFTAADVTVIQKIWDGPRRADGSFLWYSLEPGADLGSLAMTVSAPDGTAVDGVPFPISNDWFKWWLHKDPTWDWHSLTFDSFVTDFDQSVSEWAAPLATNNPELSTFKARGGRLIIWHGLADQLIFPQGTIDYYSRVVKQMGGLGATRSFARLFLAPNVAHCGGGTGPHPDDPFGALVKWREQGVAPDTLVATLGAGQGVNTTSGVMTRPLCPYPDVATYSGTGSIYDAASFKCKLGPR